MIQVNIKGSRNEKNAHDRHVPWSLSKLVNLFSAILHKNDLILRIV